MMGSLKISKMKGKKAAISATLTWVVAIIIILIIMVFYLIILSALTAEKIIKGEGAEIDVSSYGNNVEIFENFFSFMNREIEVDGNKDSILNTILLSLDKYFEIKNADGENYINKYGIKSIKDLTSIQLNKVEIDGFDWDEVIEVSRYNKEMGEAIQNELMEVCKEFRLLIPQGFVSDRVVMALDNQFYESEVFAEEGSFGVPKRFGAVIDYKFDYRGHEIEIKYRSLKKC